MEKVREKVREFLSGKGMDHADIDIEAVCKTFLEDMGRGLAGQERSLAMIATNIDTGRDNQRHKPVGDMA